MSTRIGSSIAALALLAFVACGGESAEPASDAPSGPQGKLNVQPASYDLAAGEPARFIVGLLTPEELFLTGGSVDLEFFYLGTGPDAGEAVEGPSVVGRYLRIPGDPGSPPGGPRLGPASQGRGVYEAEVEFADPGKWAVQVTADVEGKKLLGNALFDVAEDRLVPAAGEDALRTDSLTLKSDDAPLEAIDSRAAVEGEVPDPRLHEMTIADAIDSRKPTVIVFSTPTYCVSRFCGPITDAIENLGKRRGDSANFIHVEVWRDFDNQVLNKGAADWLYHDDELAEPWVFLIDPSGVIIQRWDNVVDMDGLERRLAQLSKRDSGA